MNHKPIWDYETGGPLPSGINHATNTDAIKKAALDLVSCVERYVKQESLRSELIAKNNKLKALLCVNKED